MGNLSRYICKRRLGEAEESNGNAVSNNLDKNREYTDCGSDDNNDNLYSTIDPSRRSTSALSSLDEKSVSFGGSEGPVVTEHPPPHVPGTPNVVDHEIKEPFHSARGRGRDEPGTPNGTSDQVTYRERLGGFLHPRDMRRLVTPFSASNEPELIVRRHVMLLNFDPLRAVILRDRLLVLVPDGADSLLVDLEKRVRGGAREVERSVFGESNNVQTESNIESIIESNVESSNIEDSQHSSNPELSDRQSVASTLLNKVKYSLLPDKQTRPPGSFFDDSTLETTHFDDDATEFQEWEEMESRGWIDLPFELQCLDAVLGSVCTILGKDSNELQTNSIHAMDRLLHQGYGGEEILRHMKNSIAEMTQRVKGFIRAMNMVLDETEDMALMNLSRLLTRKWEP